MQPPAFLHPFSEPARTDFTRVVSGVGCRVTDEHGNVRKVVKLATDVTEHVNEARRTQHLLAAIHRSMAVACSTASCPRTFRACT